MCSIFEISYATEIFIAKKNRGIKKKADEE